MITFYFSPGSSSMATHIALNETCASFEARPLTLQKGTREAGFLEINPNGKVPALVVDGTVLTEVAATLFYLARAFPQAGLMPAGALGEAAAVSWMSFDASTVHTAVAQGPERVAEVWRIAEQKLDGKPWCVGDTYSIADIHLFRLYWRFKDRFGLKPDQHPSVQALHDRMLQRPAVRKTIEAEARIAATLSA
jgi:glutathione S-transferase